MYRHEGGIISQRSGGQNRSRWRVDDVVLTCEQIDLRTVYICKDDRQCLLEMERTHVRKGWDREDSGDEERWGFWRLRFPGAEERGYLRDLICRVTCWGRVNRASQTGQA